MLLFLSSKSVRSISIRFSSLRSSISFKIYLINFTCRVLMEKLKTSSKIKESWYLDRYLKWKVSIYLVPCIVLKFSLCFLFPSHCKNFRFKKWWLRNGRYEKISTFFNYDKYIFIYDIYICSTEGFLGLKRKVPFVLNRCVELRGTHRKILEFRKYENCHLSYQSNFEFSRLPTA